MTDHVEPLGPADFVYAYYEALGRFVPFNRLHAESAKESAIRFAVRKLRDLRGGSMPRDISALEKDLAAALEKYTVRDHLRRSNTVLGMRGNIINDSCLTYTRWWHTCNSAPPLVVFASTAGISAKEILGVCCACVRTVLPIVKGSTVPQEVIDAVERWCDGRLKISDLRDLHYAARSSASRIASSTREHPEAPSYWGSEVAQAAADLLQGALYNNGQAGASAALQKMNRIGALVVDGKKPGDAFPDMIRSRIKWCVLWPMVRAKEGGRLP